MERLPAAIAALCAVLRGGGPAVQQIDGVTPGHLEELAGRLKGARYGVIVWVPAAFDMPGGELVGQGILDLAREATRSTRCSILTLGGTGNVIGVNQVCTWQSGYPLPTGFGQGVPEHDPYRFSARRMVSDGEADVLVWIAAFGGSAPPVRAGVPTILLAPQPPVSGPPPAVFMPVGMPGLDHAGTVFRTDSVVALRLPALRPGAAPEVASVLGEIETLLVKGRGR
jgi:formylmethanofuran dehydrogenase subunit B